MEQKQKEVKVKVLSHKGPVCSKCNQPTTEIEVMEDFEEVNTGSKGYYCPHC